MSYFLSKFLHLFYLLILTTKYEYLISKYKYLITEYGYSILYTLFNLKKIYKNELNKICHCLANFLNFIKHGNMSSKYIKK